MQPLRCLTLHEPWATAITAGYKTYETRSWRTHYRGLLAIHAGQTVDRWMHAEADIRHPYFPVLSPGKILCVVTLTSCGVIVNSAMGDERFWGDWTLGRFGWRLDDVHALTEPIPAIGHQGLWSPDPDLYRTILAAVAAIVS